MKTTKKKTLQESLPLILEVLKVLNALIRLLK